MTQAMGGLHHVTAISSDPQRVLDFYGEVLGLRFVKPRVNFDDPGSHHFYLGDDTGSPGTILMAFRSCLARQARCEGPDHARGSVRHADRLRQAPFAQPSYGRPKSFIVVRFSSRKQSMKTYLRSA
jgi:catechol 2,3-dioxygenase-like lactoylglutathione lyase family enzyme